MDINRPFQQSLPLKVEVHEENLLQARNEIQKFIKLSEGLGFGKLGLDAAIGLVPIVDGLYTGIASVWLLLEKLYI